MLHTYKYKYLYIQICIYIYIYYDYGTKHNGIHDFDRLERILYTITTIVAMVLGWGRPTTQTSPACEITLKPK